VVVKAARAVNAWNDADYHPVPPESGIVSNIWIRDGENLVHARHAGGRGDAAQLAGVTVYEREGAVLKSLVSGKRATRDGSGWRLPAAQRFDVAGGTMTPLGTVKIGDGVRPDQFTLSNVDAESMSFGALREAVSDLKAAGRPTKALEGSLWHKLSGPLSAVLMPLLGAVAAFGIARSGKLFVRAVIGMGLGFLYFVADNFALAMGNLGAYPPFLAAWAPFLLFAMIGEAVLLKTEE
jgi:lipopolysaccharide export system permease protein